MESLFRLPGLPRSCLVRSLDEIKQHVFGASPQATVTAEQPPAAAAAAAAATAAAAAATTPLVHDDIMQMSEVMLKKLDQDEFASKSVESVRFAAAPVIDGEKITPLLTKMMHELKVGADDTSSVERCAAMIGADEVTRRGVVDVEYEELRRKRLSLLLEAFTGRPDPTPVAAAPPKVSRLSDDLEVLMSQVKAECAAAKGASAAPPGGRRRCDGASVLQESRQMKQRLQALREELEQKWAMPAMALRGRAVASVDGSRGGKPLEGGCGVELQGRAGANRPEGTYQHEGGSGLAQKLSTEGSATAGVSTQDEEKGSRYRHSLHSDGTLHVGHLDSVSICKLRQDDGVSGSPSANRTGPSCYPYSALPLQASFGPPRELIPNGTLELNPDDKRSPAVSADQRPWSCYYQRQRDSRPPDVTSPRVVSPRYSSGYHPTLGTAESSRNVSDHEQRCEQNQRPLFVHTLVSDQDRRSTFDHPGIEASGRNQEIISVDHLRGDAPSPAGQVPVQAPRLLQSHADSPNYNSSDRQSPKEVPVRTSVHVCGLSSSALRHQGSNSEAQIYDAKMEMKLSGSTPDVEAKDRTDAISSVSCQQRRQWEPAACEFATDLPIVEQFSKLARKVERSLSEFMQSSTGTHQGSEVKVATSPADDDLVVTRSGEIMLRSQCTPPSKTTRSRITTPDFQKTAESQKTDEKDYLADHRPLGAVSSPSTRSLPDRAGGLQWRKDGGSRPEQLLRPLVFTDSDDCVDGKRDRQAKCADVARDQSPTRSYRSVHNSYAHN